MSSFWIMLTPRAYKKPLPSLNEGWDPCWFLVLRRQTRPSFGVSCAGVERGNQNHLTPYKREALAFVRLGCVQTLDAQTLELPAASCWYVSKLQFGCIWNSWK